MPRESYVSLALAQVEGFAQIYEFLRKYNRMKRNEEITFDRYIAQLAKFCLYFNRLPDQVSNQEYVEYYNSLLEKNPSGGTMKLAVYGVRLYFDAYQIVPPKHAIPTVRNPKRVPTYLTVAEVLAIIYSGETRQDKVSFGALYAWGLRAKELVKLKLVDIDFRGGMVCIRAAKGKKDRMIPTPPLFARILMDYIQKAKPQTYLIEKEPGVPVTVNHLRYRLKKAIPRSGVQKRIYLHLFRSTFAIHNILNGLNIYSLSKYLGHNSIVTTAQYLKALPDDAYGHVPLAFEITFSSENVFNFKQARTDLFNQES